MASKIAGACRIPNEVFYIIFADLDFSDLKSARLVCPLWFIIAVRGLFRRIYLSSRSKDLEVFNLITNHEFLRTAVRKLIYDASVFDESAAKNAEDYCFQLGMALLALKLDSPNEYNTLCPDARDFVQKYFQGLRRVSCFDNDTIRKISWEYGFIREGHSEFQSTFWWEFDIRASGEYLTTIISGLRNLPNLEKITIDDSPVSNSPFVRSWPLEYLAPSPARISAEIGEERYNVLYQHDHYVLVQALSTSGSKIKSLIMNVGDGYGVPTTVFAQDVNREKHTAVARHASNAYCNLKTLHIVFKVHNTFSNWEYSLLGLKFDLAKMSGLTNLSLDYTDTHAQVDFKDMIDETTWPHLRKFSMQGMSIYGVSLVVFVRRHFLESLIIGEIKLVDCDWDDHLDELRDSMPNPVRVCISGPLYHEGDLFRYTKWHELVQENENTRKQIEDYLALGGTNPLRGYKGGSG